MRRIREFFTDLWLQIKGETPKVAQWIRNIAGGITVIVPAAWISCTSINIPISVGLTSIIGYVTFFSFIVCGIAAAKETKQAKEERLKNKTKKRK